MALNFPLSKGQFWNKLKVVSSSLYLPSDVRQDWSNGGDVSQVDPTPRLWEGSVQCAPQSAAAADEVAARVEMVMRSGGSFLLSPLSRNGTIFDPDEAFFSTPNLNGVSDGGRTINIQNFNFNYPLNIGDYFSLEYGTSPKRYGFHRFVTAATSTGTGNITGIEINPPLRPGYAADNDIIVNQPVLKAVLDLGSFNPQRLQLAITDGFSFSWKQTFR